MDERIDPPVEFRTVMYLWTLFGAGTSFLIHFILLSTEAYNWFAIAAR